jgi:iron complex transport system ATP-binding protein
MLMPDGKWLAGETEAVVTDRHLLQAYGVPVRTLTLEDYPRHVIAPLFSIER